MSEYRTNRMLLFGILFLLCMGVGIATPLDVVYLAGLIFLILAVAEGIKGEKEEK